MQSFSSIIVKARLSSRSAKAAQFVAESIAKAVPMATVDSKILFGTSGDALVWITFIVDSSELEGKP